MTKEEFHRAWSEGWDACESFFEQAILNQDPDFQKWLDQLELEARKLRERHDLENAAKESAARQAAGLPLF
jgi:regulator of replication initiation timing